MKKVVSMILALMMFLTMCITPVMAEEPITDSNTESAEPIFDQLLVQFIGRLPSNDAKNGVFVSLSNDGENWTEPVVYSGHGMDMWGCANTVNPTYLGTIDVTEQAKALTSDKFYVKVGMAAGDITWTVLHQVRIAGTYAGATEQTEFFWEDYSKLAAFNRTGSNADEAAADVVNKVPYAISAHNAFLYSCPVDHTATGLSPYHPGYYGEPENVNAHVVYGINIEPEQPEEPTDKVYFEFLGRMPGDANGANKVQVMVGSDGETWTEAALLEGALDNHSESTYFKVDITKSVDLSANNLYVKMNLIAYLAEWCSARQIRVTHVAADGTETVLMHVIYDDMAIGSVEYKSGLYVDSANMQLRGTYDPTAKDPSGLTMTEDHDGQDSAGLGDNYITYKIVLKEEPVAPELPYISSGSSVSEDVSGLASKFDLTVEGIAIKDNTYNQADFTNATFGGYKLLGLGVIASNGTSSVDIKGVHMCALDGNVASFAFRVVNIPQDKLDVEITMTPYFVVEIDGVETTVYGEPQVGSYNSVLNG
ncbi:MAG: hypothetical protein IKL13_05835 [Clostridia bacterium]|nr:hypothetical protein [Clostridia bacterium]